MRSCTTEPTDSFVSLTDVWATQLLHLRVTQSQIAALFPPHSFEVQGEILTPQTDWIQLKIRAHVEFWNFQIKSPQTGENVLLQWPHYSAPLCYASQPFHTWRWWVSIWKPAWVQLATAATSVYSISSWWTRTNPEHADVCLAHHGFIQFWNVYCICMQYWPKVWTHHSMHFLYFHGYLHCRCSLKASKPWLSTCRIV